MGDESRQVRRQLAALQLNTKGLLELLGGDDDDRIRYWEIKKGITTPVELRLIVEVMQNVNTALAEAQRGAETFKLTVQEMGA